MTKKKSSFKTSGPLLLIALPGIIYLLINNYVPMAGLFLAFKNYNFMKGIFGSDWCGFDNFKFLFASKDAWIMTRNTVLYNLVFIILGTAMAIFLAILICELGGTLKAKFFQSALILPNLLSWVIVAFVVFAILNADTGFINNSVLKPLGFKEISWYTYPKAWPFVLVVTNLWKSAGYSSIIYMASISGIDKALYESAALDGATKVQQIFRITLPMLKPTVITMTLMSIGKMFYSDFGLFYQVPQNSGALFHVTQTIDTYVYRGLMELNDVGMSAAAGFYQSIVGLVLVLAANMFVRKLDQDNALF
nr:ABC transporter permease subunit [uncultured Blautia sp.]